MVKYLRFEVEGGDGTRLYRVKCFIRVELSMSGRGSVGFGEGKKAISGRISYRKGGIKKKKTLCVREGVKTETKCPMEYP